MKRETFGLPRGTVRGILALVAITTYSALLLIPVCLGHPTVVPTEFLAITTLIIGFYFGQKGREDNE